MIVDHMILLPIKTKPLPLDQEKARPHEHQALIMPPKIMTSCEESLGNLGVSKREGGMKLFMDVIIQKDFNSSYRRTITLNQASTHNPNTQLFIL